MRIAFDALPLLSRKTGIGFCEAGQVHALASLHPEQEFVLNYFAAGHLRQHKEEIGSYLARHPNLSARHAFCPAYLYRAVSGILPLPYDWFFGHDNQLTHFFNYIIPPGVSGKTVVTVHDMVCKAYPETVRGRTKYMLDTGLERSMQRADRIVTDSAFSAREITKYYPAFSEKIRVVPCGVDSVKFHPVQDRQQIMQACRKYQIPDTAYFLYLGTIEPRKNLERLIAAYAVFVRTHAAQAQLPKLVLAGGKGWLYAPVFRKIQQLHLEQDVILTEYISDADIAAIFSGAMAFVFPSVYEGFGMPPLEAMACGTPVIVSEAASLPEVTGTSALLVRPDDTDSIAAGLHRVFTSPALRATLHRQGLARAALFSWEASAEALYQVYEELLP